jgi:alginate O-acetyltransferase complex protein AlgJ
LSVVNLLDTLATAAQKAPIYYKTDTHWNQKGAGLAAESVANRVRSLGVNLPLTEFVSQTAETPVERAGDLLKMMGLVNVPNWARPDPDWEPPQTTTRQAAGSSAPLGLLGDAAGPPVVLVGTSYSLRANFHGQLQEQLKTEVLNVAKDGGGFMQAMSDYLNDDAFRTAPPKLVIWEVPERVFSPQLTELEKAPITAPQ